MADDADQVARAALWERQRARRVARRRAVMASLAGDNAARLQLDDEWGPFIPLRDRYRNRDRPPLP